MESDIAAVLSAADSPVLVTHRHADRDSVGSAVGLAALLGGRPTICLPDGVAAPAQSLLEGRETVETVSESAHDLMVVLDAPSTDRIAPVEPLDSLAVVDHHAPGDLTGKATASLVDEDAGSTAELVHRMAREAGWTLSPEAAFPLLVGVLDDTAFLRAAGPPQVEAVVELLAHVGGREAELASLFDPEPDPDERTARIKATARASFHRAGDVTLAVTRVGGHESAAARALRDVGVDCALVASERGDGARVVGRCSESFADRLSLGEELLPELADAYGGSGGGHHTAAVAHLDAVPDGDLSELLERAVADALGVQFGRLG